MSAGATVLDLSTLVVITEPGYYVLDRDWAVYGADYDQYAITVDSDNVFIDLQGFLIETTAGVYSDHGRVTVQNGRIRASIGTGVTLSGAYSTAHGLIIDIDEGHAVFVQGYNSKVSNTVLENDYGATLYLGPGATAQNNIIYGDESEAFTISGASQFMGNRVFCGPYECGEILGNGATFANNVVSVITTIENPIYVRGSNNVIFNNLVLDAEVGSPIFFEEGDGTSVYHNNLILEETY